MTIGKYPQSSISIGLSIMLLSCICLHPAISQTAQANRPAAGTQRQTHPVSLAHLYWHFLTFQNHLDAKAAELGSRGKNGADMRQMMQQGLGFRDAEYAPIRSSSVRLTAEVKALDARAAAIRAEDPSDANQKAMMALSIERETDIAAEISYLKRMLTPQQVKTFEAFLIKLFSPSNAITHLPQSNSHPTAPVVQK